MKPLKPLRDQVIVITGASSGIGLVTARLAARRGARVVLVARNALALDTLRDDTVFRMIHSEAVSHSPRGA